MKRMSDVFELPVSVDSDGDIPVNSGGWLITSTDVREPAAQHAARAINHVDALADALEALTSDYAYYMAVNDLDLTDDHSAALNVKMNLAIAVLAAYRGEK